MPHKKITIKLACAMLKADDDLKFAVKFATEPPPADTSVFYKQCIEFIKVYEKHPKDLGAIIRVVRQNDEIDVEELLIQRPALRFSSLELDLLGSRHKLKPVLETGAKLMPVDKLYFVNFFKQHFQPYTDISLKDWYSLKKRYVCITTIQRQANVSVPLSQYYKHEGSIKESDWVKLRPIFKKYGLTI
jgi:hypothetical protein